MAERLEVRMLRPRESDAQATIVELAQWHRWLVAHFRPARTEKGWRTPVAADGKGFVDLVLARDRVIHAELKKQGERPRPDQVVWLDALARAGGEVYVWTLDDFAEIGQILDRKWSFVPFGGSAPLSGVELDGPRLFDWPSRVSFAPRSAWIPGIGRRDGA